MPKYYFNLKGNGDLIESDRPIQFPCLATAKADALAIVRGMLADLPGDWQCGIIGSSSLKTPCLCTSAALSHPVGVMMAWCRRMRPQNAQPKVQRHL